MRTEIDAARDAIKLCATHAGELERAEAKRDTLAAIVRELIEHADALERGLGLPLVGSPHHLHDVPGIWNSDNGELAGKPCTECAAWDAARAARAKWEGK